MVAKSQGRGRTRCLKCLAYSWKESSDEFRGSKRTEKLHAGWRHDEIPNQALSHGKLPADK